MNTRSAQRLAGEMARTLSEILACEVRDEELSGVFVLRVELVGNRAKVFFSSQREPFEVAKALERAKGFLRAGLARDMGLQRVPNLIFVPEDPNRMEE